MKTMMEFPRMPGVTQSQFEAYLDSGKAPWISCCSRWRFTAMDEQKEMISTLMSAFTSSSINFQRIHPAPSATIVKLSPLFLEVLTLPKLFALLSVTAKTLLDSEAGDSIESMQLIRNNHGYFLALHVHEGSPIIAKWTQISVWLPEYLGLVPTHLDSHGGIAFDLHDGLGSAQIVRPWHLANMECRENGELRLTDFGPFTDLAQLDIFTPSFVSVLSLWNPHVGYDLHVALKAVMKVEESPEALLPLIFRRLLAPDVPRSLLGVFMNGPSEVKFLFADSNEDALAWLKLVRKEFGVFDGKELEMDDFNQAVCFQPSLPFTACLLNDTSRVAKMIGPFSPDLLGSLPSEHREHLLIVHDSQEPGELKVTEIIELPIPEQPWNLVSEIMKLNGCAVIIRADVVQVVVMESADSIPSHDFLIDLSTRFSSHNGPIRIHRQRGPKLGFKLPPRPLPWQIFSRPVGSNAPHRLVGPAAQLLPSWDALLAGEDVILTRRLSTGANPLELMAFNVTKLDAPQVIDLILQREAVTLLRLLPNGKGGLIVKLQCTCALLANQLQTTLQAILTPPSSNAIESEVSDLRGPLKLWPITLNDEPVRFPVTEDLIGRLLNDKSSLVLKSPKEAPLIANHYLRIVLNEKGNAQAAWRVVQALSSVFAQRPLLPATPRTTQIDASLAASLFKLIRVFKREDRWVVEAMTTTSMDGFVWKQLLLLHLCWNAHQWPMGKPLLKSRLLNDGMQASIPLWELRQEPPSEKQSSPSPHRIKLGRLSLPCYYRLALLLCQLPFTQLQTEQVEGEYFATIVARNVLPLAVHLPSVLSQLSTKPWFEVEVSNLRLAPRMPFLSLMGVSEVDLSWTVTLAAGDKFVKVEDLRAFNKVIRRDQSHSTDGISLHFFPKAPILSFGGGKLGDSLLVEVDDMWIFVLELVGLLLSGQGHLSKCRAILVTPQQAEAKRAIVHYWVKPEVLEGGLELIYTGKNAKVLYSGLITDSPMAFEHLGQVTLLEDKLSPSPTHRLQVEDFSMNGTLAQLGLLLPWLSETGKNLELTALRPPASCQEMTMDGHLAWPLLKLLVEEGDAPWQFGSLCHTPIAAVIASMKQTGHSLTLCTTSLKPRLETLVKAVSQMDTVVTPSPAGEWVISSLTAGHRSKPFKNWSDLLKLDLSQFCNVKKVGTKWTLDRVLPASSSESAQVQIAAHSANSMLRVMVGVVRWLIPRMPGMQSLSLQYLGRELNLTLHLLPGDSSSASAKPLLPAFAQLMEAEYALTVTPEQEEEKDLVKEMNALKIAVSRPASLFVDDLDPIEVDGWAELQSQLRRINPANLASLLLQLADNDNCKKFRLRGEGELPFGLALRLFEWVMTAEGGVVQLIESIHVVDHFELPHDPRDEYFDYYGFYPEEGEEEEDGEEVLEGKRPLEEIDRGYTEEELQIMEEFLKNPTEPLKNEQPRQEPSNEPLPSVEEWEPLERFNWADEPCEETFEQQGTSTSSQASAPRREVVVRESLPKWSIFVRIRGDVTSKKKIGAILQHLGRLAPGEWN